MYIRLVFLMDNLLLFLNLKNLEHNHGWNYNDE